MINDIICGSTAISEAVQSFDPGKLVELFVVDLTSLGGGVTRWANATFADTQISFGGDTFLPLSMETEGFDRNGKGTIPTPTIRIFPTDGIRAAMVAYGDFIGAKITRIKTFSRFLDGQPDADSSQVFPNEVWFFEQKTAFNKEVIEWSLSSTLDQEGVVLPKRVFLKDICQLKYRYWDGSAFIYTPAADGGCPYTSSSYYDVNGTSTTASGDKCGKRLSECKRRFGNNALLPFLAFPGITAYRRR